MRNGSRRTMSGAAVVLMGIALLMVTGCASYRTNSSLSFTSAQMMPQVSDVVITTGALPGKTYTTLGPVKAVVKKLSAFHANPTREQADAVLAQKARELGADAVINVVYKSGVTMSSWGAMIATGTAVRLGSN